MARVLVSISFSPRGDRARVGSRGVVFTCSRIGAFGVFIELADVAVDIEEFKWLPDALAESDALPGLDGERPPAAYRGAKLDDLLGRTPLWGEVLACGLGEDRGVISVASLNCSSVSRPSG